MFFLMKKEHVKNNKKRVFSDDLCLLNQVKLILKKISVKKESKQKINYEKDYFNSKI